MRVNLQHSYADRGNDCYWTPVEATMALMAIETLPRSIADPCCGSGAILNVLDNAKYIVHGSDIIDYGWRQGCTVIRDYLAGPIYMGDTGIVSNPPYRLAEAFIRKAVSDNCIFHAWLLRLNFVESTKRLKLFRHFPPARIWVSSRRLPMMHRLGWEGPTAPSNQCFAWFVWNGQSTSTTIEWFDWKHSI